MDTDIENSSNQGSIVAAMELLGRAVPYSRTEVAWAQCRPGPARTRVPEPGDEVFYRHNAFEYPVLAQVVSVQPEDDLDDPNMWRVRLDNAGRPVVIDGRPLFVEGFDQWPLIRLKVPKLGLVDTREARLRGSPGWLPLDWYIRDRPKAGD